MLLIVMQLCESSACVPHACEMSCHDIEEHCIKHTRSLGRAIQTRQNKMFTEGGKRKPSRAHVSAHGLPLTNQLEEKSPSAARAFPSRQKRLLSVMSQYTAETPPSRVSGSKIDRGSLSISEVCCRSLWF